MFLIPFTFRCSHYERVYISRNYELLVNSLFIYCARNVSRFFIFTPSSQKTIRPICKFIWLRKRHFCHSKIYTLECSAFCAMSRFFILCFYPQDSTNINISCNTKIITAHLVFHILIRFIKYSKFARRIDSFLFKNGNQMFFRFVKLLKGLRGYHFCFYSVFLQI